MNRKLILQIYEAFADRLKIEIKKPFTETNFQGVLAIFNHTDPKIHTLLSFYESANQNVLFFEKEKEMRIKFPEIWRIQLQQAKESSDLLKTQIIELGTKHKVDIEQIFNDYERKSLSLEDFSQIV